MNQLLFSFCTTCKGRLNHLKETLPHNLKTIPQKDVEFIILDFDDPSPDELFSFIKEQNDPRIKYHRINNKPYFIMGEAKNYAHKVASGEILINIDADCMLRDNAYQEIINAFRPGFKTFLRGKWGLIAVRKKDFDDIGGYDPYMIRGSEDEDLINRLRKHGLNQCKKDISWNFKHDDETRYNLYPFSPEFMELISKNRWLNRQMKKVNEEIIDWTAPYPYESFIIVGPNIKFRNKVLSYFKAGDFIFDNDLNECIIRGWTNDWVKWWRLLCKGKRGVTWTNEYVDHLNKTLPNCRWLVLGNDVKISSERKIILYDDSVLGLRILGLFENLKELIGDLDLTSLNGKLIFIFGGSLLELGLIAGGLRELNIKLCCYSDGDWDSDLRDAFLLPDLRCSLSFYEKVKLLREFGESGIFIHPLFSRLVRELNWAFLGKAHLIDLGVDGNDVVSVLGALGVGVRGGVEVRSRDEVKSRGGLPLLRRSWDLFDTLIGRKCGSALRLFEIIGLKIGISDFVDRRVNSEKFFYNKGVEYSLYDVYSKFCEGCGCDDRVLAKLEWECELDNVYPIRRNVLRLKSSDIIVSDTYLSESMVRELIQMANICFDGQIIASCYGKSSGSVWPIIKNKIISHCGDNLRVDFNGPKKFGINAIVSFGFTKFEEIYLKYSPDLAWWIRYHRLNLLDNEDDERLSYLEIEFNIPLLLIACRILFDYVISNSLKQLLFMSRDGQMFYKVWKSLYDIPSKYVYINRKCLCVRSESYLCYLNKYCSEGSVLIDLASSLKTISLALSCFNSIPHFWCIFLTNQMSVDGLCSGYAMMRLNSNLTPLEMLNYADHWHVADVDEEETPIFDCFNEYDMEKVINYHQLLGKMLNSVPKDFKIKEPLLLIRLIVEQIQKEKNFLKSEFPNHIYVQ